MVQELCSGPCIALEIKPQSEHLSILKFRELIGPLDVVSFHVNTNFAPIQFKFSH